VQPTGRIPAAAVMAMVQRLTSSRSAASWSSSATRSLTQPWALSSCPAFATAATTSGWRSAASPLVDILAFSPQPELRQLPQSHCGRARSRKACPPIADVGVGIDGAIAIEQIEQSLNTGLPAIIGKGQREVVDLAAFGGRGRAELAVTLESLERQPDRQRQLLAIRPAPAARIAC